MYSRAALPQQLLHTRVTLSIDCLMRHTQIERFMINYSDPPGKYYTRVRKTTTIYKLFFGVFFFTFCSQPLCVQLSAAVVWKYSIAPLCDLTFGVIKIKWSPIGSPLSPATLFFSLCRSIALSLIQYMLCLSLTLRLTGYWHVLGHLAARQMEPFLLSY